MFSFLMAVMQEQTDRYEKVIERSNELREQKEELSQSSQDTESDKNISNRTFISGLTKGRIIDLEYKQYELSNSKLVLTVKLSSGCTVSVSVTDEGSYSDENELTRLLEWKQIPEGRIDDLVGKTIRLKSSKNFPRKHSTYEDIQWDVYVPDKLDSFGRTYFRLGFLFRMLCVQSAYEEIGNLNKIEKVFVFHLYACIASLIWMIWVGVMSIIFDGVVVLGVALVLTMLVPTVCNYILEPVSRYSNHREGETI